MRTKLKARLLQAPAIVLLVLSFIGSVYVKLTDSYQIRWGVPLLLGIILASYFWGRKLEKSLHIY